MSKVFLIGLPGSGKSTFGVQLAVKLSLPFIDLDQVIEQHTGRAITDLFGNFGEAHFRSIERSQLLEIDQLNSSYLLATGGGTPCYYDSMSFMKKQGVTVYLNPPIELIIKRLQGNTDRPLLNDNHALQLNKLYEKRKSIYKQSHITWQSELLTYNDTSLTDLILAHKDV
ncbi:MAG: shikimate kinase [Cyclobacteriaceae bacterium]|jgi:shikimate kinase